MLEEQPIGTKLTTLQATDADSNIEEYHLSANDYFEINNLTGLFTPIFLPLIIHTFLPCTINDHRTTAKNHLSCFFLSPFDFYSTSLFIIIVCRLCAVWL